MCYGIMSMADYIDFSASKHCGGLQVDILNFVNPLNFQIKFHFSHMDV